MSALLIYSGAPASAGDNTLVAAPGAGTRICPVLVMVQGNTATADTLLLYDGASATGTKLATLLAQNQGDGAVLTCVYRSDDGQTRQIKCSENKALVLNKAQAVATNVTVWYYLESTFGS